MDTSVHMLTHQADIIDVKTKEIRAESNDTYSKLEEIADELPDSSPRFVLLSYPHTLVCLPTRPANIFWFVY
jgi:hypothetical protein